MRVIPPRLSYGRFTAFCQIITPLSISLLESSMNRAKITCTTKAGSFRLNCLKPLKKRCWGLPRSMDEKTSLINIGELSRPATMLVEKISDAVGGIFKPYQVVRVAKAEAQADRVRAESQIEISDIQRRAFRRFLDEEGKKQKNIEDITGKALPQLEENSQPNEVEDDWITNFFDRCRLISDDEMQGLWSRVLAGEANAPGTYSKRTVNFLSDLDKGDAELFTHLCGFSWMIGNLVPLVYDEQHEIYNTRDINFNSVIHL